MKKKSSQSPGRRQFLGAAVAVSVAASAKPLAGAAASAKPQAGRVDPNSSLAGIKQLLAGKAPVVWIFTGDSITHGALHTLGWRSYPEHFAERVRWELRRMRDVVINTGISGDQTGGLLADLDWRVLHFQPHVVSIMLGMNDCSRGPKNRAAFKKNMQIIVEKVQAGGAIPLLSTPNTIYLKNAAGRSDLPAYADIVRDLAAQSKLALADHWAHWQKTKPNQEDLLPWLEDKSIHPGVYGHRAFAREIFRVLGIYDDKSPTCKLEVP